MSSTRGLLDRWQEEARLFRRRGAAALAECVESMVTELERALQAETDDELNLNEAATRSGYSADHLRRLVRERRIQAFRRGRRLFFRRGDLPRKPVEFDGPFKERYDLCADARQVIARRSRGGSHETQEVADREG
jgi:hypothetical protein